LEQWKNGDAVCFDVDSTVCVDEGIDELAEFCGAGKAVAEWTARLDFFKWKFFFRIRVYIFRISVVLFFIRCLILELNFHRAMGGSVPFEEALAARLSLFNPSLAQLQNFLQQRPPRYD
jgi:phosphoserine phosphatase